MLIIGPAYRRREIRVRRSPPSLLSMTERSLQPKHWQACRSISFPEKKKSPQWMVTLGESQLIAVVIMSPPITIADLASVRCGVQTTSMEQRR